VQASDQFTPALCSNVHGLHSWRRRFHNLWANSCLRVDRSTLSRPSKTINLTVGVLGSNRQISCKQIKQNSGEPCSRVWYQKRVQISCIKKLMRVHASKFLVPDSWACVTTVILVWPDTAFVGISETLNPLDSKPNFACKQGEAPSLSDVAWTTASNNINVSNILDTSCWSIVMYWYQPYHSETFLICNKNINTTHIDRVFHHNTEKRKSRTTILEQYNETQLQLIIFAPNIDRF